MTESKKQQMLKKLEDLKLIIETPKLYLANYFQELRNDVDKQMFSKQMLHINKNEVKIKIDQIWIEMISKIDSFEKECKNKDELQSNSNKIDEIKIILENNKESTNLEVIEDKIQEEELNLFRKLFQNKTIIFQDIFEKEDHKRLIIVKDEYLNWKPMEKFLDSNLIKQIRMYAKIHSENQQDILEISIDMIQLKLFYFQHSTKNDCDFLDNSCNFLRYLSRSLSDYYQPVKYSQLNKNNDLNLLTGSNDNTYIFRNNFHYSSMFNIELTQIKENAFVGLNNLQKLSLKNNQLTEIKQNAFISLNNLQKLYLEHNQLTEIKENAFNGLNNLHILYLKYNQLTEIKENSFIGLNNLQQLDLSYNQLKEIKENTFIGLKNLQELFLDNNKLKEIKENSFISLNNLRLLSLDRNELTEIKEKTFISLNNLKELALNDNKLTEIKENSFISLNNLQELALNNNQLTKIKENTFIDLNNLQALDLSDNQLTEIKENTFIGLISLQVLGLGSNQLTEIKENTFIGLINLQHLYLWENQTDNIFEFSTNFYTNCQKFVIGDLIIKVDVITISENILTFYACFKNHFIRDILDFFMKLRIELDRGDYLLKNEKKICS